MNLLTAAIQVHAIVDSLPRKDSWEIFYYCSTAVLALIAGFTLFAIRNQAKKTAEAAQATRDATEAIQRQADLMEGQTRATENAAKAARDNAEAARLNAQALINTERPWLVVTWASDPRTPGLFRFRCRNHGNTPAMVIALSAMPLFAQNPNLQTPPSYLAPGIPPDLNIIVHGRSFLIDHGVNAEKYIAGNGVKDAIYKSDQFLVYYGNVVYRDTLYPDSSSEGLHETRWCFFYRPYEKRFVRSGPVEYNRYT